MNKSNTKSNNSGNEKWKCNIILEMLDCLYGLSDVDSALMWQDNAWPMLPQFEYLCNF